ncbi:zinc finger protein ZXDC isoform X2 [Scleropages formosus]|uniref:zinc finger protein ZXDC isoform X2 n=1 Tax=Scleropages formosus TaxID=113540 RepID=UPI0010FAC0E4|nr:zinc finger protein ZXDC-like isoform X2 [Scleropages formosus]
MCRCYRDTKMEIQGLSRAQNTQQQHGVSCRRDLSRAGARIDAPRRAVSSQLGLGDYLDAHDLESDNNNNRPGTSPFLLEENGSGAGGGVPALDNPKQQEDPRSSPAARQARAQSASAGLCNVGGTSATTAPGKEPSPRPDCPGPGAAAAGRKFTFDNAAGDSHSHGAALQMALPVDVLQQQGPLLQPTQPRAPVSALQRPAAAPSSAPDASKSDLGASGTHRKDEQFYVVFSVAHEGNGSGEADSRRAASRAREGDTAAAQEEEEEPPRSSSSRQDALMEVQSGSGLSAPEEENVSQHLAGRVLRKPCPARGATTGDRAAELRLAVGPGDRGKNAVTVGTPGGGERHHPQQPSPGEADAMEHAPAGSALKSRGAAAMTHGASFPEAVQLSDATGSAYLPELNVSAVSTGACGPSNASPSDETFSGTIMINNQSIVVTIENGVLTLLAPQDGHSQKEDAAGSLFSLKEQLGVKDHQDIVLINYDSTAKSFGKNGNVAVGAVQYEEPRACLSVNDSGLTLEEDCTFSDPGSVLDSCASAKDGTFCSLTEGEMVDPGSKVGSHDRLITCDGEDLPSSKLSGCVGMMSRKGALVTYRCPQSDCSKTFDTKHKLKIHLLSHTEDQRPFKCPVEGCGWSFTTSYKLKRHLQSHDKVRPFTCEWENCGRKFTTVYNLKAHIKAHDQENTFVCEICSERFRSATRLGNHQRTHFEPERPHKCEFPGCEKTFITFSALFSHNRTHFREIGQFTCSYPGCDKRYDKACRLKIHLRSHTGERPFVCDSEGCGWSFTSMSKLLRHKRKHDDDRRFTCPEEGCGKSFTRAEHLKGHSITHLGTKPFECHVEGCSAKFSARSSLYIHSKKHQQDGASLRTRCPVANCSKHFSSRGSLKSHMLKHHNISPDLLSQLEMTTSLTPSSELTSTGPTAGDMDLGSLFSSVPGGGAGVTVGPGTVAAPSLTMDMSLVSSGILTIDAASVGTTLGAAGGGLAQAVDPLILAAGAEVGPPGFDGGPAGVLPQGTLNLDDVQTVNPEALGSLAALALRAPAGSDHLHTLSSSSVLTAEPPASLTPSSSLAATPGTELLSPPSKPDRGSGNGPLLGSTGVLGQQEGSKVVTQFVFPGHAGSFSAQKDAELNAAPACSFLESGGSARTDYRAIQLAKKKKQKGPGGGPAAGVAAGGRFTDSVTSASGELTLRDPVTGTQYVQIQLLQDDPASDGELAFQLSSQTSSSHSQLTVDLPVNILQEPPVTAEDDAGSDASQFTGSTINLQDLE